MIVVGLDPGTVTGLASWHAIEQRLMRCESMPVHVAMEQVRGLWASRSIELVIFEDARQRKYFTCADQLQKKYGAAIREGAGAAKRDATIWNDFLRDLGVPFIARKPMATKRPADEFQRLTHWAGRTNEHARDAAMIVVGLNRPMVQGMISLHRQTTQPKQS